MLFSRVPLKCSPPVSPRILSCSLSCRTLVSSSQENVVPFSCVQPIADRVAQHLDLISKNFQFSTRRTRILMGFIIHYLVLIVNPMGRIMVRWKSFRNNLEILCHHICNWLYFFLALSGVLLSCPLLCPLKLKILGDTGVDNEKNFNTRGKTILGDTGENSLLSFFLALVSFSRVP